MGLKCRCSRIVIHSTHLSTTTSSSIRGTRIRISESRRRPSIEILVLVDRADVHVLLVLSYRIKPVSESLAFIFIRHRGRNPGFRFNRLFVSFLTSPSENDKRDYTNQNHSNNTSSGSSNDCSITVTVTTSITAIASIASIPTAANRSSGVISSRPDIQIDIVDDRDIVVHGRLAVRAPGPSKDHKLSCHEPTCHASSVS